MYRILKIILFLFSMCLHSECNVYQDRPKIKTSNGNLVLEAAYNKNIYLRTNGPKSTVFVGDVNLLNVTRGRGSTENLIPQDIDVNTYINGPDGILSRLSKLESNNNFFTNGSYNLTLLWRRLRRQRSELSRLQNLINERAKDECQSRPCQNGGTCLNLPSGYFCLCPSNWEGQSCDIDVNECRNFVDTDLGCQNGGKCINKPGSYECQCRNNWIGLHCTATRKNCSVGNYETCGHGTCLNSPHTGEGILCICNQGWTKTSADAPCIIDVDECESSQGPRCSSNPKVDCINLPGSFRCGQCPLGYEGDGYTCSDIDECLTIKPNGGCSTSPMVSCHNIIGSRICGSCPPGYEGDGTTCTWRGTCNIDHGSCHPSARCVDNPGIGGVECVCPAEMEGDGVGLQGCYIPTANNETRSCENHQCVHGRCHALRSGYTCICYRGYGGSRCDVAADNCVSSPCLHGGTCRTDESTNAGFRCECPTQFTGDLCHIEIKTCGGLLSAEEGSIIFPLSNNTSYINNAKCAWVIEVNADKVINITFSKFNLESSPECLFDFLQIHDGRSPASQMIGRYCGNTLPNGGSIVSSHNKLYFWFRSDHSVAKDGFSLHWTSQTPVCGGEVDASKHGVIYSPGSPGSYPPNRDCYWYLTTSFTKRIQIVFYSLDIEKHSNCSYDYVSIYDGPSTSQSLLGMYCNSSLPSPVQSAGPELTIHFHSDRYKTGKGFQITYSSTEGIPGCGGLYTAADGEIISPSYDGKYLSNLYCEYKIKIGSGYKIRLNFTSFKLEPHPRCIHDFLKVYDGPTSDSGLVGTFCGSTFPRSYTSSSNTLFIIFKTDVSIANEGFKLVYKSVCEQTINGESGIIKSPGYPFSYPINIICDYVVHTTPGKAIQLVFQDFDIENSFTDDDSCDFDFVVLKDGATINSATLGKYCGNHIPPIGTSTHNYMFLRLNSDMSLSGTGFYANYTSIDTECGGIFKERTGVISHPNIGETYYKNDQSCTWMIIAPEGMHIHILWNRFQLESLCKSDHVELFELDESNGNFSIGRYCGSSAPPVMDISTNRVLIRFVSDGSLRYKGFSLSYSFVDDRTNCGGRLARSYGVLHSPGWPKRYDNNLDCTWTIVAPVGQQIKLNISKFNLEKTVTNHCHYVDYLEIRNGMSANSPLIGKYCGKIQSKLITSMANYLYIRFHSDAYLTGEGFQLEWDSTVVGCGGVLTSASGSIGSPNYPQNYHDDAECFYKIITSAGSRISITFKELELEQTEDCQDDYVEIYDGQNENSHSLGRYCTGNNTEISMKTTSNTAFIKFRSDFLFGGKGFFLEYKTVCLNNITGYYGVVESPGYPDKSSSSINCLWSIIVPKGNKINVTITNLDISFLYRMYYRLNDMTNPCGIGYLQIKDSNDTNNLNKLCTPLEKITKISSKTNLLEIKFVINYPMSGSKFRLEWAQYGCSRVIQKNSGTITIDKEFINKGDLQCEWRIETAPGTRVTFYTSQVNLKDSLNCTLDAIEVYNGQSVKTPLLTKFCHKAATRVQSTTNFMLIRLVKKSSLKDINLIAYFYSDSKTCGGIIESSSGFISSNNYPKNYDINSDCMWTLIVPRFHRVELKFLEFDLYAEHSGDCSDHIKIYDGEFILNKNYTKLICPDTDPNIVILSKSNMMGLQFISNEYGNAKGFKANFTVTCGSIIDVKYDGVITNDKVFNHYDINCTWIIRALSPDQHVSLIVTHMSIPRDLTIPTNRECPSSYLRILDGNDENAPIRGEYCGHKVPPTIVSHGSAITLQFGAYNSIVKGTFSAHYSALTSTCGGTITSEEGTIASPLYPMSYPVNMDCEWTLNTAPGNKVYIEFEELKLDYSEDCNEDYLEVRENYGGGKLLGIYCGNEIPTNTTVSSKLYIKFHSDSKTTGRGFLLHYGFLHGNDITGLEYGEIASPLYPYTYDKLGVFTWRVLTEEGTKITVTIDHVEIPTEGNTCFNSLILYDGYDTDAPILEEYCGMYVEDRKILHSTSNVVMLQLKLDYSNSGSLFHVTWSSSKDFKAKTEKEFNCGLNYSQEIIPGQPLMFSSPDYPNNYKNNLNCQWVFKTSPGHHLSLNFVDVSLEQTPSCTADSISIYSAEKAREWRIIKDHICLSDFANVDTSLSTNAKIKFKSDGSLTNKGFNAKISSVCGGIITDSSGIIEPVLSDLTYFTLNHKDVKCDWLLKVRPGRKIRVSFDIFNITNTQDNCKTYVILRNGDSAEAPMLGNGKFCGYGHENRSAVESSGRAVLVQYSTISPFITSFTTFILRYEEINFECGVSSKLDDGHRFEYINTPNYPFMSNAYSECVWVLTGPPGVNLRIDFIEKFDLIDSIDSDDCSAEVVEIRDGSTDLSPSKGRFCGKNKPGTIKTEGNTVYINYLSTLAEPGTGFKANVSIDICGGTIVAEKGEIMSPGYPHMQFLPYGTVCEWKVQGPLQQVLKITIDVIDLPHPEAACGTKIVIEETLKVNNTLVKLYERCADSNYFYITNKEETVVETSTNEAIIKLQIGKPESWSPTSDHKGFRFTFHSSRSTCGGVITTSEGFIATPGYPRDTTLRYCQWLIEVPNKDRRIRLEIIDSDLQSQRIGIYNDINFRTSITTLSTQNISNTTVKIFESTGNKLSIYLWITAFGRGHRFKARFSSDEEKRCGGELSGYVGNLRSPDLESYYTCEWNYRYNQNYIMNGNQTQFKSIYITGKVNSTSTNLASRYRGNNCGYGDPKLTFKLNFIRAGVFLRNFCGNKEISMRIPSTTLEISAGKSEHQGLDFNFTWKLQPCGGHLHLSNDPINILNTPDNFTDSLDCAWLISVQYGSRVELKLEGEFQLLCEDEYVQVSQGISEYHPIIAEYCKDRTQETTVTTSYIFMLVQYHSKAKNRNTLKLMARAITKECGGTLTHYDRMLQSPNYPKSYTPNIECSWKIIVDLGNRVNLQFVSRFFIEKSTNCSKDAVIIYDWIDSEYKEVARLCGRELPPAFNSTLNKMKVVLRTDSDVNGDGFEAVWTSICGGSFIATENEQFIYSPGYPNAYLPLLDCNYTITSLSHKIILKFDTFQLEGTYPTCENDKIQLIGSSDYDTMNNVYCGTERPPIIRKFNEIVINFKTDSLIQRKGFKLSYKIYDCGGLIKEPMVLSSGPLEYDHNLNCTWQIEAPNNIQNVVLKFQYIDIEHSTDCYNDQILVYNGLKILKDTLLARLCGRINSTTVLRSSGNAMLLQFITDSSLSFTGFKADVSFTYAESSGCGRKIDMTQTSKYYFHSPLINGSVVYENFLDCLWEITAPIDYVITVEFNTFHVASCLGVNQTALGINNCKCDTVEITDGLNFNDLLIDSYCGHTIPPQLTSSSNKLSIRFVSDGDIVSSGFQATLSLQRSKCGQSLFKVSQKNQVVTSPGYNDGIISRGLHCTYHFEMTEAFEIVRIAIKNLDIRPGDPSDRECNKDFLSIHTNHQINPNSMRKDYIYVGSSSYEWNPDLFMDNLVPPRRLILCGKKSSIDLYLPKSFSIDIRTSMESDSKVYRGFEIEVVSASACNRNYTELQGRIKSVYVLNQVDLCYTLITAPDNYTISLYFLDTPLFYDTQEYIDIYDGNNTSAKKLQRLNVDASSNAPLFSNGKYMLLVNHGSEISKQAVFDLNFVSTDKGRGCGGKLNNIRGSITSPLYPATYRHKGTCEWELETPVGTHLFLRFTIFDLGISCDQNYLQFIDRAGKVLSTFCSETPAEYRSEDNYIKIAYVTSMNNGGTGWMADFGAVV